MWQNSASAGWHNKTEAPEPAEEGYVDKQRTPWCSKRMTPKNLPRIGAQAPKRSLPLGQLGAAHKPSESSLKTSHPWAEKASVVVRTGARSLENDHFSTQILTWEC